jgi:exodeoxyribonuclease VII large subunit
MSPRMKAAADRLIAQNRNRADHVAGRLQTAYQALRKPLLRGYAIVRDAKGKLVMDAVKVKPDAALSLEFHDGKVQVATPTKQGKLL